jgi:hypothetical protein
MVLDAFPCYQEVPEEDASTKAFTVTSSFVVFLALKRHILKMYRSIRYETNNDTYNPGA